MKSLLIITGILVVVAAVPVTKPRPGTTNSSNSSVPLKGSGIILRPLTPTMGLLVQYKPQDTWRFQRDLEAGIPGLNATNNLEEEQELGEVLSVPLYLRCGPFNLLACFFPQAFIV